jgi:8-oxo-dGTP diphosphatase
MANSKLYGQTTFRIPGNVKEVVKQALVRYPNEVGHDRARFILGNEVISYEAAKRIKNYFDHAKSPEESGPAFYLYGGHEMKSWLEQALSSSRGDITREKTVKSNAGFANQFRKEHEKTFNKVPKIDAKGLNLPKLKRVELFEEFAGSMKPKHAAISCVFNQKGELLLLKRKDTDGWMPGKWALVGGGVNEGENPEEALTREVKEETKLDVNKVIYCFTTKEDKEIDVYVFIACCTNPDELQINEKEHTDYAWVPYQDVPAHETVPNVAAYMVKCLEIIKEKGLH